MSKKIHRVLLIASSLFLYLIVAYSLPGQVAALEDGWSITAPSAVSLPSVAWSLYQGTTTLDFTTEVLISNNQSTTQGFTAQVTSTEFIHSTDASLFMGYTLFDIKTGAASTSQPDGITTPINGTYTAFSGTLSTSNAINFMVADARSRSSGSWGITPSIRLRIPAKQRAGTYNATLTFSLL